jgi:hypothetical protein
MTQILDVLKQVSVRAQGRRRRRAEATITPVIASNLPAVQLVAAVDVKGDAR